MGDDSTEYGQTSYPLRRAMPGQNLWLVMSYDDDCMAEPEGVYSTPERALARANKVGRRLPGTRVLHCRLDENMVRREGRRGQSRLVETLDWATKKLRQLATLPPNLLQDCAQDVARVLSHATDRRSNRSLRT